jgi:hypothetical protein
MDSALVTAHGTRYIWSLSNVTTEECAIAIGATAYCAPLIF